MTREEAERKAAEYIESSDEDNGYTFEELVELFLNGE